MRPGETRRTSLRTRLGIIAVVFLAMIMTAIGRSALMIRSSDRALDAGGDAGMAADDVTAVAVSNVGTAHQHGDDAEASTNRRKDTLPA